MLTLAILVGGRVTYDYIKYHRLSEMKIHLSNLKTLPPNKEVINDFLKSNKPFSTKANKNVVLIEGYGKCTNHDIYHNPYERRELIALSYDLYYGGKRSPLIKCEINNFKLVDPHNEANSIPFNPSLGT
jgi:hypothetical protein